MKLIQTVGSLHIRKDGNHTRFQMSVPKSIIDCDVIFHKSQHIKIFIDPRNIEPEYTSKIVDVDIEKDDGVYKDEDYDKETTHNAIMDYLKKHPFSYVTQIHQDLNMSENLIKRRVIRMATFHDCEFIVRKIHNRITKLYYIKCEHLNKKEGN